MFAQFLLPRISSPLSLSIHHHSPSYPASIWALDSRNLRYLKSFPFPLSCCKHTKNCARHSIWLGQFWPLLLLTKQPRRLDHLEPEWPEMAWSKEIQTQPVNSELQCLNLHICLISPGPPNSLPKLICRENKSHFLFTVLILHSLILCHTIDWVFIYVPHKFLCWNLIPNVMVLGDGVWGGSALMNGIDGLIKEAPAGSLASCILW